MKKITLFFLFLLAVGTASAQFRTPAQQQMLTNEDSLNSGVTSAKTVISGYGSAFYSRDFYNKNAVAGLDRAVLFVGHQFNRKITFFSEMEVENAVASSGAKGEIAMEQAFLKFNLNSRQYIVAGLFIPRIGLLNENHLPVNFNGVMRPLVETAVIPATWREIGVGFYGSLPAARVNYSLAVVNGLQSDQFTHGTGIVSGRSEGSLAGAENLAVTASLQYQPGHFKFQVSGYAGGTVGLRRRQADSLLLNSGTFGTPIYLGEANAQWSADGLSARVLGVYITYPDAEKVNRAFASNIAESMYGAYAELAFDWLYHAHKKAQLITFVRADAIDLNASVPVNGLEDGTIRQKNLLFGAGWLPIPNVVVKADVRLLTTGDQNPLLLINPSPNALPYQRNNTFLNFGIGYSF